MTATTIKFSPKIEIFNPFKKPFSSEQKEEDTVVDRSVKEYMVKDNAKAVAKCTPCQCCACR